MKEWSGTLNTIEYYPSDAFGPAEQVLIFDIETTGFSPKNTYCYMIGYCYIQENRWNYRMLFNNDGHSEAAMLDEFFKVLSNYSLLLHYNGDGFDVPYLKEKYLQYTSLGFTFHHENPFDDIKSIDLYKILKPFRKGLELPNLKLPTIEDAMGGTRKDSYTGGELIKVYRDYLKTHESNLESHLYQHNYEDITAMIPMLRLFHFQKLSQGFWHIMSINTENEPAPHLSISISLDYELPLPFVINQNGIRFECCGASGTLRISLIYSELRYYFENWKDYYYLPVEDTVIHKSVAAYVDSAYKEKAKKTNCYLKKTSAFLPLSFQPEDAPESWKSKLQLKIYKSSLTDKSCFIEWTEDLKNNTDFFTYYISRLL